MNCPSCGAALEFDDSRKRLTCNFCGSMLVLEPGADGVALLGAASPLKCPQCRIALEEAAVDGRQVLCCPRCRGLLVATDSFVDLVDGLRAKRSQPPEPPHRFDPKDLDRVVGCPRCGARMDTHPYGGPGNVVISTCEFCRLEWLDHGALGHIVAAPDGWRAVDNRA